MHLNPGIRELYLPVQPLINRSAEDVLYTESLPDERLHNFIYYYWQLKTTKPLPAPFEYRIVADGCIDIFFELSDPAQNFVMGFSNSFVEFPLPKEFHYVGIRFLPTMFTQLFNVNSLELSQHFEPLENVAKRTSDLIAKSFGPQSDTLYITSVLNQHFLRLTENIKLKVDARLYEAVNIILKDKGMVDIQAGLRTGISSRQLRRLFEFYIGTIPKTFSKVVRFQNFLKAQPTAQALRKNKLFLDAGYYDQAHFIKEFKSLYGDTPAKALK